MSNGNFGPATFNNSTIFVVGNLISAIIGSGNTICYLIPPPADEQEGACGSLIPSNPKLPALPATAVAMEIA